MRSDDPEPPGRAQPDSPAGPTSIARGTGRRMLILAGAAAGVLLVGFFVTYFIRLHSADRLAAATATHAAAPPLVDVVTVRPAPQTDALALPGEAAAWQESTIYARVDGYVGKWFVDIGDHVHEGQVLATIETPTLDAQLVAAQARLRAADAEVTVREAEARFPRSVTAGSPSGNTPLYRMTENDPIRIFVFAPQSAAASMKVGTPAHI